jgi:HEPN domain-containing protein
MTSRNDFKKLSDLRLDEAKILLKSGLYDGAFYLGGYAIEFALKARICKVLDITHYLDESDYYFDSFRTHNLEELLILSGLKRKFYSSCKKSPELLLNWQITSTWNEELRYASPGKCSEDDAKKFINAIKDPKEGVLTWIKTKW